MLNRISQHALICSEPVLIGNVTPDSDTIQGEVLNLKCMSPQSRQNQGTDDRYQRTYFYIQVARHRAPVFTTPEPGEEEDEAVIDKSSHEAWGAEQRRLIEEGKRPEFDHTYALLRPWSSCCRLGRTNMQEADD